MSQHTITAKNHDHLILTGFDPALNTFYLHVIDQSKDEDEPGRDVHWVGCTPNEIHDLQKIMDCLDNYALWIGDLRSRFEADLIRDSLGFLKRMKPYRGVIPHSRSRGEGRCDRRIVSTIILNGDLPKAD